MSGSGDRAAAAEAPAIKDPNTNKDTLLPDGPGDSISCVAWSPVQNLVAAGSWDKSVHLWEVQAEEPSGGLRAAIRTTYSHEAPVLCCRFTGDGQRLISGGCDKRVMARDLQTQQDLEIGCHDAPVRELAMADELGLVVSGSWDKTLRFWSPQQAAPVAKIPLPERVYAMDARFPLLVIGCADRNILVYDLKSIQHSPAPQRQGPSSLRMQTRSIACFPDRSGYALGSVEGRCSISYFDDTSSNFTFKCHRTNQAVHAVNAIDFHPTLGTFATAGSDGTAVFWDKINRMRLKQFESTHYPITAAKFNAMGNLFAYAVSYDWSRGHEPYLSGLPTQLLVHRCQDAEVRPRKGSGGSAARTGQ